MNKNSLLQSRTNLHYSPIHNIENSEHNERVVYYIEFVGMLLLFGGGDRWGYIGSTKRVPRGKKHTYNKKELSYHYIAEETCMCILGQKENQCSSVEQIRSFKTVWYTVLLFRPNSALSKRTSTEAWETAPAYTRGECGPFSPFYLRTSIRRVESASCTS